MGDLEYTISVSNEVLWEVTTPMYGVVIAKLCSSKSWFSGC